MKNKCPSCNVGLDIPDAYVNKTVICPKCKKPFKANLDDAQLKNPAPTPIKPHTITVSPTPVVSETAVNNNSTSTSTSNQMYKLWPIIKDFFLFRILIYPWVIIGVFALCTMVCAGKLLMDFFTVPSQTEGGFLGQLERNTELIRVFFSLREWLIYLLGLLWFRVSCELSIIIFRIYSKTEDIHQTLKNIEKENV